MPPAGGAAKRGQMTDLTVWQDTPKHHRCSSLRSHLPLESLGPAIASGHASRDRSTAPPMMRDRPGGRAGPAYLQHAASVWGGARARQLHGRPCHAQTRVRIRKHLKYLSICVDSCVRDTYLSKRSVVPAAAAIAVSPRTASIAPPCKPAIGAYLHCPPSSGLRHLGNRVQSTGYRVQSTLYSPAGCEYTMAQCEARLQCPAERIVGRCAACRPYARKERLPAHSCARLADTGRQATRERLSGLCLCKGEAKIGPGRPGPPILNIWVIIVVG